MKDWFEKLTGFVELDYELVQERLYVQDGRLHSRTNSASYAIGTLELVSLRDLRARCADLRKSARLKLNLVQADARALHRQPENADALFQVASQFNMLEMTGPTITPEHGVTRYVGDHTQGPACAIAAGAATIFRNYFAPVGDQIGQTEHRQLNGLADLGATLAELTGRPVDDLWKMENGYALAEATGLDAIGRCLSSLSPAEVDGLRERLMIGIHWGVEVTDAPAVSGQKVSQAFCSALPLGYSRAPARLWEPFARLILEAAYEATLCGALLNARRSPSRKVFLTLLGAGAFGNPLDWVLDALGRALNLFREADISVSIVSYGAPDPDLRKLVSNFELGA